MNVRSITASISVTITYLNQISYRAQIPHYQHAGIVLLSRRDVICDFYYIHGPTEDWKKPTDFCCFRCVIRQWALTVIKFLRFFDHISVVAKC